MKAMKVAGMTLQEYRNFYNLGQLQRQLSFLELSELELKHLDLLREEVDARLVEYRKPGKVSISKDSAK